MLSKEAMEALFLINNGDASNLEVLVVRFVSLNYERVYQVESNRRFALHDKILDIYNTTSDDALYN